MIIIQGKKALLFFTRHEACRLGHSLLSPTDVRAEVHCRQFEAYSRFLNTTCWTVKFSPLPCTSNSSCHWTPAPGHLGLNPMGRQTRWQDLGLNNFSFCLLCLTSQKTTVFTYQLHLHPCWKRKGGLIV